MAIIVLSCSRKHAQFWIFLNEAYFYMSLWLCRAQEDESQDFTYPFFILCALTSFL